MVGGDFYDFFMIDEGHLGLVIADVSGKGVPAALFMMVSSALIRQTAAGQYSPAKILQTVNHQICDRNPEEMFVTVWLGILEIATGKLTAANAGHEYPMIKRAGERFEMLKDRHGLVVGAMDGVRYRDYEIQLEPGAKLFVYTDGVSEAVNEDLEQFGTERILESLRRSEEGSPEEILGAVVQAVKTFAGNTPQFDDLTMMCVEYRGA
jgi:serine phosphatase RsbU (regulator of sigma subunit)